MKFMQVTALALTVGLSGCASVDPYTGEQKTSNTTKGALGGAVLGAVVGAATAGSGNKDRAILTGAAAGAAVGGGTGYYMDRQEKILRQRLQGSGVQVKREGDNIQHTDNTGGADLNQMLSEQRATSVKMYLIGKKVAAGRVNAAGYSYRYPITSNSTAEGRQANRRVELSLEPLIFNLNLPKRVFLNGVKCCNLRGV